MLKLKVITIFIVLIIIPLQGATSSQTSNITPIISFLLSDSTEEGLLGIVKGKIFYVSINNAPFTMQSWSFSPDGLSYTSTEVVGGTGDSATLAVSYDNMTMTAEDGTVIEMITEIDGLRGGEITINGGSNQNIFDNIAYAKNYFRLESSTHYIDHLLRSINPVGDYFGWTISIYIDRLQSSIITAKSRITQGELDLEDEDVSAEARAGFDSFIQYISDLESLVIVLNEKNTALDLAIRNGMSVEHINNITNEIRDMVYDTPMYNFFEDISIYYAIPLPTFYTDENGVYYTDYVNIYVNEAGDSAWHIKESLLKINLRMLEVDEQYTQIVQENIEEALKREE